MQWEYVERGGTYGAGYQRADYRGLVIEAHYDCDARNPFTEFDCEPPLLTYGRDNGLTEYGDGAADALGAIADGLFKRHWRAIAKAVDLEPDALHAEALEAQRDYGGGLVDIKRERVEEALDDIRPSRYGGNASDYFSALAALWAIAGRETLEWTSRGYSQGDWADCLLVATPAWEEASGCKRENHADALKGSRRLFDSWAWGDVFGYVIKAPGGADLDGLAFVGDSVWGYYGDSHDESGLEESAMEAADGLLADVRHKRQETLKRLIRNRVPLAIREELLADVAGPLAPLFSGKESDNDA